MSTLLLVIRQPSARKLVDVRQQLPPDWAALAEQKNIAPSFRAIATKAGLATSTVTRLIVEGRTSPETVTAVAKAFGVDESRIYDLAELPAHADLGPWSPPAEANQLGGAEREVLEDLIRVMAKGDKHAARSAKAEKSNVTELRPGFDPADKQRVASRPKARKPQEPDHDSQDPGGIEPV